MKIRVPGEKLSDGLAWLAFILAIIGGFAATSSFIGDAIGALVNIVPSSWGWGWAVPLALGAVGLLLILGDLIEDGIPDRLRTVYITILWPSTWISIEGKLGDFLAGWIKSLNKFLDGHLAEWISDDPRAQGTIMSGVAIVAISFALVWAHRYAKKKKDAKSTSTSPVATSRSRTR